MLLLLVLIVATLLRQHFSPYAMELASSEFMPRGLELVLSGVLLFATAVTTNRMAVRIGLFNDFCALPLSLYAVVGCGIYLSPDALAVASAAFAVALGVLLLLGTLHTSNNKEMPLFCGVLFGVALLCYPPSLTFAAVLVVAAWVVPLNPRQLLAATAGYLLPVVAASYVSWYCGADIGAVVTGIAEQLTLADRAFNFEVLPVGAITVAVLVAVLVGAAALYLHLRRGSMLSDTRKGVMLLYAVLAAALAAALLPSADVGFLALAAIPVAVIVAALLNRIDNGSADILYILLMVVMLLHLFIE